MELEIDTQVVPSNQDREVHPKSGLTGRRQKKFLLRIATEEDIPKTDYFFIVPGLKSTNGNKSREGLFFAATNRWKQSGNRCLVVRYVRVD